MKVFSLTLKNNYEQFNQIGLKVHHSVDDIPTIKNAVLTLGTFDGVHLGHQNVISFLKESASKINGETVLFTFHPHPRIVLNPDDHGLRLIQSIDERIKKLASYGIDHLILFPFTKDFSRLTATTFVRDILVNKINVKLMTIGYNHHFGRNRSGNLELLKELGPVYEFEVQEIPAFSSNSVNISSTKIRTAIENGEIEKANQFLGSVFEFSGVVVKGDQIGSTIGYPTANIKPNTSYQIIPQIGVYAVGVIIDGKQYKGMMNIGKRPTVSKTGEDRIEVHLFNFNQEIYGKDLLIKVYSRIRSEQTFESLHELKAQLKEDEISSITLLDRFFST